MSDINTKKEELKSEIKNNFNNLRKIKYKIISKESLTKVINDREKQLIAQIDIVFNSLFFDGEKRKEYDKILLKSSKIIERIFNAWNDEKKLSLLIGNCIIFENCIEEIKTILNDIIKKFYFTKIEVKFSTRDINDSEDIYSFGEIIIGKDNNLSIFFKMIKNRIKEFNYKKNTYKLIYDAELDGQEQHIHNSNCNNIPNTFFIITTNNNHKFCFFRSKDMNGNYIANDDEKAFFFSYDKDKIYKIKKKTNVNFPYYGFFLPRNIFNDKCSCFDKNTMNYYFEGFTEDYELNGGKKEFYITKYEVYQLYLN